MNSTTKPTHIANRYGMSDWERNPDTGDLELKKEGKVPFAIWMCVGLVGVALIALSWDSHWGLHVTGAVLAFIGCVGAHQYKWNSLWFQLIVLLGTFASLCLHLVTSVRGAL